MPGSQKVSTAKTLVETEARQGPKIEAEIVKQQVRIPPSRRSRVQSLMALL